MCHGDLLGFLRASRGHHGLYTVFPGKREQLPPLNLTSRDIINIAAKIASGMMFLEKKKVHLWELQCVARNHSNIASRQCMDRYVLQMSLWEPAWTSRSMWVPMI